MFNNPKRRFIVIFILIVIISIIFLLIKMRNDMNNPINTYISFKTPSITNPFSEYYLHEPNNKENRDCTCPEERRDLDGIILPPPLDDNESRMLRDKLNNQPPQDKPVNQPNNQNIQNSNNTTYVKPVRPKPNPDNYRPAREWTPPAIPTVGHNPIIGPMGELIFDNSSMTTVVCLPEKMYTLHDKKYRYYAAVYASLKDETLTLKEWLEHYLWQGVDHFFLIDNGSTDKPLKILEPYIRRGLVSYQYRPKMYQQQPNMRETTRDYIIGNTFWLIQVDIDEFWFAPNSTLVNWLKEHEHLPFIRSHWWIFSSTQASHPKSVRQSNIMTERISSYDIGKSKWIAQTEFILDPRNVDIHHIIRMPFCHVENHEIRLYHYQVQSMEFFSNSKMARGSVQNPLKYETRWGSIHNAWKTIDDLNRRCKEPHYVLADLVRKYEASSKRKTLNDYRECI